MSKIPLEDLAEDIISKAQRGLEIPTEDLAQLAGVPKTSVLAARKGQSVSRSDILEIAKPLQLDPEKLAIIWEKSWYPDQPELSNLVCFNTPFYDMSVNAYLYINDQTRTALLFDTGVDASPILNYLSEKNLNLDAIIITHTHRDHIEALDPLREQTNCNQILCPHKELIPNTIPVKEGDLLTFNTCPEIEVLETSGHCKGGLSYYIKDSAQAFCFVGDSIFAGSMGGGMVNYQDALENNKNNILSLPDATILCPGHGPLTTVANEKQYNPFF